MCGECRKPIIGKETGKTVDGYFRFISDQPALIALHLSNDHFKRVGVTRQECWVRLFIDPETGLYWEAHLFQSGVMGGEAESLLPLSPEDVRRFYFHGCRPPRKAGEPPMIEGGLTECKGEGVLVPDQAARIAGHLEEGHLLDTGLEREEGRVRLYADPTDGSYWEVKGYQGTATPLLTITELSLEEVADLYPEAEL